MGLKLIAAAKLVKGVVLAFLALGVFDLIHKDLAALAHQFVEFAKISPENRYVSYALEHLGVVDQATLMRVGLLSALYATVLITEGIGLWVGASWAEYMVVISSGLFVPEELSALVHRFSWAKLAILAVNAAILIYVTLLVWRRFRERRGPATPAEAS